MQGSPRRAIRTEGKVNLNHVSRNDESAMFKCKQGGDHWEEGFSRQRELAWRTKVTVGS